MKTKFFMMAALAASMAFTGCSSDDSLEPNTGSSKAPKSVTINLANVVQGTSRSAGGEDIQQGDAIMLNSYQIFFSDGTTLYTAKDINNQNDAEQYFSSDESELALTQNFHFLPYNVNKVIIIGNRDEIQATTEAELDKALAIAEEQDAEDLTLYDESGLTAKTPAHEDGNPLYEATLEPAPRIARLFINGFSCEFSDPAKFNSLKLEVMALNNYYTASTIAKGTVSALTNTTLDESTIWDWFNDKASAGFAYDALGQSGAGITLTPQSSTATADLYYHVFPGVTPQLALRAEGDNTPLYLITANLVDESNQPVTLEAGTIYKMNFAFKDTDFEQPDKCVDITVTPVKWVVKTVKPSFE